MDVVGQWFFAGLVGHGFKLVHGDDGATDAETCKGVIFLQGRSKIQLHCASDGWWEGPPDSGLRLCRSGPHLLLRRRRGSKGRFRQSSAARSQWVAAFLWCKSLLSNTFLATKDPPYVPVPPPPDVKEIPPEIASISQEPFALDDEDAWPEPEAEGLPEQPSIAQDQNSMRLLMNSSGAQNRMPQPEGGSYCVGITSFADDHAIVRPTSVMPIDANAFATAGLNAQPEQPKSQSDHLDMSSHDVERQGTDRVVAEVANLRTTIHGLLAVPEDAELPDVASPMAPSKSDSNILHGSIVFDGDLDTWLFETYGSKGLDEAKDKSDKDMPPPSGGQPPPTCTAVDLDTWLFEKYGGLETRSKRTEVAPSVVNDEVSIDLGSNMSSAANVTLHGQQEETEDDPRLRSNPLVRSHRV